MFLNRLLKIGIIATSFVFVFFQVSAQGYDYYWVGGNGNWSDTLNWDSEVGGLPSSFDDVYFNESSFKETGQSLIVDIHAQCHNMDWSNVLHVPTLTGNNSIDIYGSFTLSSQMDLNFTGDLQFLSAESNNYITTAGQVLNSNIFILGEGTWLLSDALDVGLNVVEFQSGALNTQSWPVYCGSFISNSGNPKILKLNSSIITIRAYNGIWDVDDNLALIKDDCGIFFTNDDFTSKNIFSGGNHEYCKVVFENDAVINDNNKFGILYFNAGHTYSLKSGNTQTLINKLVARGCAGLIRIEATASTQAILSKSDGVIELSYVSFQSIDAQMGNGTLLANYSIDLGNNTGDIVIDEESRNMHWVNGTGYWSDTTQWSSLQGGMDEDCLPLMIDNLFFDENSFIDADTVFVDFPEIVCNNMNWSGNDNAFLTGSLANVSLTIFGSLQFSPFMINDLNGPTYFRGETSNSIITSDVRFKGDVIFDGPSASWTISDSLKVGGNLIFNSGSIELMSDYMECNTFHSDSTFARTLSLGNAELNIKNRSPYPAWSLNNENLQFNAGESNIILSASSSVLYNYGGDTVRYHNVDFTHNFGVSSIYTYLSSNTDTYTSFKNARFGSNGNIYGSNLFDSLFLSAGNIFSLQAGKTQTIQREIITPDTSCTPTSLLQSLSSGGDAYIQKPLDTLLVKNLAIQDIHTLGEANYIAENSADLANNVGWDTIMGLVGRTLYWVGGSGNWEDPMHWDEISNGTGGMCIPSPVDTVVFNNFSFTDNNQSIIINNNNAFARNLLWDDVQFSPEFGGSNSSSYLRVFGSLQFDSDMNFTFPGIIYFGSRNKFEFIRTSGINLHNINNHVYFNGAGGEWNLQDSLNLGQNLINQNYIYFQYGDLNTHGHPITCFTFSSRSSGSRKLSLDTSTVSIFNNWDVFGNNLEISESNSIIKLDSGNFIHRYGSGFYYNDVILNSNLHKQQINIAYADSVFFKDIFFNEDGQIDGTNSNIYADSVLFAGNGKITDTLSSSSVYVIDTLIFQADGEVFGDDTISYVRYEASGKIDGNGIYNKVDFTHDGFVSGDNTFDTLIFTPDYSYVFEEYATQIINDSLQIWGNNCESIYFSSSGDSLTNIQKDTGFILGDFIEMQNINAIGNAIFDAGSFSTNVDNSNLGWTFHSAPLKYSLGNDTTMLEGDTIVVCADNFNGNESTTYIWTDESGTVVGNDSCLVITENGVYSLTVLYDEGAGCSKTDTITVGCFLGINVNTTNISCYNFYDGNIDLLPEIGVAPFQYVWCDSADNVIGNGPSLSGIPVGKYFYKVTDAKECLSKDSVILTQPDTLILNHLKSDACFNTNNGFISLDASGGSQPYSYHWSDGSADTLRSNLAPGNYSVTMLDANCPAIVLPVEIIELSEIEFDLESIDLNCYQDSSGSISTLNIIGGNGVYSNFIWERDNLLFDTVQNIEELFVGEYQLTIVDDLGCISSQSRVITQPDEIIVEMDTTGIGWLGEINLLVSGGIEPYYYQWNTGETTKDISNLEGGLYTVEVEDSHACISEKSIFVDVQYKVFAPTAFSPNGDDINDVFKFQNVGTNLASFDLSIYNRWGQTVFTSQDPDFFWNGRLNNNGEMLSIGVFTWQASIELSDKSKIFKTGNITLLK